MKEQSAQRNIQAALRLVEVGKVEASTKDEFSKLLNRTVSKSELRESGKKKIAEGEAMLVQAANTLKEIYAAAKQRATLNEEAQSAGILHEWTSTDGRTLQARFVSLNEDQLTVVTGEGRQFVIPLERLIQTDWSVAKILDSGRGFNAAGYLQAIASGENSEVQYFIDAGFEPALDMHGEAFLEAIALEQNSAMLQLLIDSGLNVNSQSSEGASPLSHAVQAGKLSAVRILLTADADPMLPDTAEPGLSPIIWSMHKWDPVISKLLFLQDKEKLGPFLASMSDFINTEYFKPISLETAKRLQEVVRGKKLPSAELEAFKLSLVGLELTIVDLEKVIISKDLRPLVVDYHTLGFYRHTLRRNQEYFDALLEIWKEQHAAGEPSASYSLALAYLEGWGDLQGPEQAEVYLSEAIKGGHTPSMVLMGEIHEQGILGQIDLLKAYELYREAAALNDPLAMVKMGHCFENALSVEADLVKAIVWYERAIESGSAEGMAQLGRCYLNGIGVNKDASLALEWYAKAVEKEHLDAIYQLAVCYSSGIGGSKNQKKAFDLFNQASSLGHMQATANLALCYANGLGVAVNEEEASRLSLEVLNSKDASAIEILGLLSQEN